MSCPNSDPNFDPTLTKLLGHPASPEERKKLFYTACIPTRLVILLILYFFRDSKFVQIIAAIAGAFAIYNLSRPAMGNQWWNKKFQLVMACLIVLVSILILMKNIDSRWLSVMFGVSLLGGFLESLSVKFC